MDQFVTPKDNHPISEGTLFIISKPVVYLENGEWRRQDMAKSVHTSFHGKFKNYGYVHFYAFSIKWGKAHCETDPRHQLRQTHPHRTAWQWLYFGWRLGQGEDAPHAIPRTGYGIVVYPGKNKIISIRVLRKADWQLQYIYLGTWESIQKGRRCRRWRSWGGRWNH